MPWLQECPLMLNHEPGNTVQFMGRKAAILDRYNWIQPGLGDAALPLDVDMRRLALVELKKTKL
jgi:hypothetical protein